MHEGEIEFEENLKENNKIELESNINKLILKLYELCENKTISKKTKIDWANQILDIQDEKILQSKYEEIMNLNKNKI